MGWEEGDPMGPPLPGAASGLKEQPHVVALARLRRDDGLSYHDYVEQLTCLLSL